MKKILTITASFSLSVKKALLFLVLAGLTTSASLVAQGYSSIPSNKVAATDDSLVAANAFRKISEDEWNGATPILLGVNEQVIIPISYQAGLDNSRPHQIGCGVADTNFLSSQLFDEGTVFPLYKLCGLFTGLTPGQTTISFCYDDQVIKSFNVTVVDTAASPE